MKNVRTLADAGEITEMLNAVRELSRHMNATDVKTVRQSMSSNHGSAVAKTFKDGELAA
jgi:hypothetical protein